MLLAYNARIIEFLYSIPLTAYKLYLRFVLSYNLFQSYFVYCKLYIHFMNISTQVFKYIANVTLIFIKISFMAKRVLDTFVIYICFSWQEHDQCFSCGTMIKRFNISYLLMLVRKYVTTNQPTFSHLDIFA